MTHLADIAKRATLAALLAFTALPALAFTGADSFAPGGDGPDEPGPGDWGGPDGFAPTPPGPGPAGPGAATGGEGSAAGLAPRECPNGILTVTFELDDNDHAIPETIERTCTLFR